MGDEHTGPLGAGSEPTSGLPPSLHTPAPNVTRATAPGPPLTSDIRHPTSAIPTRIGRYSITRVLGEGGMGTVYEAQQESPKRTVALKVIRAGYLSPELLRRFTQESQVLGRLQHPGIAQVYEAGMAKDEPGHERPFFAMEFIKGVPLTEYVNQKRLGTRDRLELVAKVCDAVYHAHQKGVIHRDLKPGNILEDESGQPKILDFGIARATDSDIQQTTLQTDIGQLIGTIPYMSPEQVGGDPMELDTRSDVYALGVIAYEILAGRLPYDLQRKMIHEAARIIKEEEPTRLSSINRTLRGDVETIVARALEKDKVRRYQSAESLASDIRRYLKDEPIAARPASTWYQASRFAKRNKGLVTGLAAAFVLLIAGLIGTTYGLRQAVTARDNEAAARRDADAQKDAAIAARNAEEEQRKAAEAQRDKAEKIAEFMSDTLAGAGPSVALGRDITMLKEMMDAAAARIEKGDLKDAPEAELRLRGTIGNTYVELALYPQAGKMIEPAVTLARSLHAGDHPGTAMILKLQARLLKAQGDAAGAEVLCRESLDMYKRLYPGDHHDVAGVLNDLAAALLMRGDMAGAEPLYRQSLEMYQRLFPGDNRDVAGALNNLGRLHRIRTDYAGGEPLYRQALEMFRRLYPGDHPDVATALGNHAAALADLGDLEGAEKHYREALDMKGRLFPGDHPGKATSLEHLANVLRARGDLEGAEAVLRESLDMRRRLLPGDHPDIAGGLMSLATVVQFRGKLEDAEPFSRESLDMYRRLYPGDHPDVALSLNNRAALLIARGDLLQAQTVARESTVMFEHLFGSDNWNTGNARLKLGRVLTGLSRFADAEPELVESERVLAKARGAPPGRHKQCLGAIITLYESWDRAEPGKGYDAKAAEWKSKLAAANAPPPETATPPDSPPK